MDKVLSPRRPVNSIPTESSGVGIPKYSYRPLNGSNTIRILRLFDCIDRIECSIQQTSLSGNEYQALSYVWGSEERPYRAIVRDENRDILGYIPLTANLRDALCDLRNSEELPNKVFWIDQICINQESDEKSSQVAIMGQIFRNAIRVITYLGPSKNMEEDILGIRLLNRLHHHFANTLDMISQFHTLDRAFAQQHKFPTKELPTDLRIDNWPWLLEVAFGEWTQRLWMVQEQLLNPNTVMLRGQRLIPWTSITAIPELSILNLLIIPHRYRESFWQSTGSDSYENWRTAVEAISTLRMYRRASFSNSKWNPVGRPLLDNMLQFSNHKCRDSRDYVFALLSLSCDWHKLGISPNYSSDNSAAAVFLDATIRIFKESGDIDMLGFACACNHAGKLALPSWSLAFPPPKDFIVPILQWKMFKPHPH
jgi:hypothetical protein